MNLYVYIYIYKRVFTLAGIATYRCTVPPHPTGELNVFPFRRSFNCSRFVVGHVLNVMRNRRVRFARRYSVVHQDGPHGTDALALILFSRTSERRMSYNGINLSASGSRGSDTSLSSDDSSKSIFEKLYPKLSESATSRSGSSSASSSPSNSPRNRFSWIKNRTLLPKNANGVTLQDRLRKRNK